jgi:hypothetical protein
MENLSGWRSKHRPGTPMHQKKVKTGEFIGNTDKDKVILIIEKMTKGYCYEIELEPRHSGSYSLNHVRLN